MRLPNDADTLSAPVLSGRVASSTTDKMALFKENNTVSSQEHPEYEPKHKHDYPEERVGRLKRKIEEPQDNTRQRQECGISRRRSKTRSGAPS